MILETLERKFTSTNEHTVSRATITHAEYLLLLGYVRNVRKDAFLRGQDSMVNLSKPKTTKVNGENK